MAIARDPRLAGGEVVVLSLALPTRVFLDVPAADMRRGFDSPAGLVRDGLGQDPLSGNLFVFRSRRDKRLKLPW